MLIGRCVVNLTSLRFINAVRKIKINEEKGFLNDSMN